MNSGFQVHRPVMAHIHVWYANPATSALKAWAGWNVDLVDRKNDICSQHDPDTWLQPGKRDIASAHYPAIGPYSSDDPDVVRYHDALARAHGIDGFIIDWVIGRKPLIGKESFLAVAADAIFREADQTGTLVSFLIDGYHMLSVDEVVSDVLYLARKHGSSPSFLRHNGRLVFFFYMTEGSDRGKVWPPALWAEVRAALSAAPYPIAMVCGECANISDDEEYVELFDGCGQYNPTTRAIHERIAELSRRHGKFFASTIQAGHDHRAIKGDEIPVWPRRDGVELFVKWSDALRLNADFAILTSWNEWFEGTEIEPSREYGDFYLKLHKYYIDLFKAGKGEDAINSSDIERAVARPMGQGSEQGRGHRR